MVIDLKIVSVNLSAPDDTAEGHRPWAEGGDFWFVSESATPIELKVRKVFHLVDEDADNGDRIVMI